MVTLLILNSILVHAFRELEFQAIIYIISDRISEVEKEFM